MATNFQLPNDGNISKTEVAKAKHENLQFWNNEYTQCLNVKNKIGFSLSNKTVDLMGRKIKK